MLRRGTERLHRNLGSTDYSNSVRPILVMDIHREIQSHLDETEIPIGETDLPRVCGSGYDI